MAITTLELQRLLIQELPVSSQEKRLLSTLDGQKFYQKLLLFLKGYVITLPSDGNIFYKG